MILSAQSAPSQAGSLAASDHIAISVNDSLQTAIGARGRLCG